MAVDDKHPDYAELEPDWAMMRDARAGERRMKERGTAYLPTTSGQARAGLGTGQPGLAAYTSYVTRARVPEIVDPAVRLMTGLLNMKPPVIVLPERLEPMRDRGSKQGESLELLLRRVQQEVLTTGRAGLLVDVPSAPVGPVTPYLVPYRAEHVINWDVAQGPDGIERPVLVVLDETAPVRTGYSWADRRRFLVLALDDAGLYTSTAHEAAASSDAVAATAPVEPTIAGSRPDFIPFTFVGPMDLTSTPDKPPLLALGRATIGIYRLEADYRHALFMQGQDTLVVTGGDAESEYAVGADATITVPIGGDAKFIGVDSSGLSEMRAALENDRAEAAQLGARLLRTSADAEAAETLRIRIGSQTADLGSVARSCAAALEQALRHAGMLTGMTKEQAEAQISVEPNMDFIDDALAASELLTLMQAKALGAPISLETMHELMRRKELTGMTLEEELDSIGDEDPLGGPPAGGGQP